MSLANIILARCPRCGKGKLHTGFLSMRPCCKVCEYNFFPESGFYLGAMMVGYLVAVILIIPFIIVLKICDVDTTVLFVAPFCLYALIGPFIICYSRVIWLHLEYQMTSRLDETHPPSKKNERDES